MIVTSDGSQISHYIYDANGERAMKYNGTLSKQQINQYTLIDYALMDRYTYYPSPLLVFGSNGYSKHYFIEGQRVMSRIGDVWDAEAALIPLDTTPDGVDLNNKADQIEAQLETHLACLALAGEVDYHVDLEWLGWETEPMVFFYHPDHLGSSSFITGATGEPTQHLEYLPFGELFIEERSTWNTPYKFSAKELDDETGYSYFGARYYDPNISIWLSVDPLSDKYPGLTSYSYCAGNPIMLMDPDGREVIIGGEARRAFYKEVKKGAAALGISVRMNRDGVLSAKYKGKGDISKDGQMFLDAVSSTTEKVKINATNSDHADGMPFCGGAFMGNEITSYSLGRGNTLFPATITANQIVNPNDLRIIDNYYGKSGQTSIHEITEAHQGALLSMGRGISSGNANAPNSVYQQAHIAATPQSGIIYENRYDAQDNWLPRGEWHKAKWIDYNVGKPPHDNNVKTIELN